MGLFVRPRRSARTFARVYKRGPVWLGRVASDWRERSASGKSWPSPEGVLAFLGNLRTINHDLVESADTPPGNRAGKDV
jgi:hypothetical protein